MTQQELAALDDAMAHHAKSLDDIAERREWVGTLQRAGKATKEFFAEVWDSILGIGRKSTIEERLAELQKARGNRQLGGDYHMKKPFKII